MGGAKFWDVRRFDGNNYVYWSKRMTGHLISLGYDIWKDVRDAYKEPKNGPTTHDEIEDHENNARAVNAILAGPSKTEFFKVMNYTTAKKMWDKLATIYQGDSKVQQAKLQTYRSQFEGLKMSEEENIAAYFQRVEEVVNTMKGLGETMDPILVVQKILRTLTSKYNPKVSVVEDMDKLDELKIEELQGILTTYEMRIQEPRQSEASFKVYNNKH